jgi:hypothetical protein
MRAFLPLGLSLKVILAVAILATACARNSRRTHVLIGLKEEFADPKLLAQMNRNDEQWEPTRQKAITLAREMLGD